MNGTHPTMLTCLSVDGETLAHLVRYSTEQGRPVAEILAEAVAQYAPKWPAGPATKVEVSHQQPVAVRESTAAEIAETDALKAETMAALLGLPAHS